MTYWEPIWTFKTKNFTVVCAVTDDTDLDLSWDDEGTVKASLESGLFVGFVAKVSVYCKGMQVSTDYLGGCIYNSAQEFRDQNIGHRGYFGDMVREAISQARQNIRAIPHLR